MCLFCFDASMFLVFLLVFLPVQKSSILKLGCIACRIPKIHCFILRFGLFEAMSAIEIMDPKMDAGMICNRKRQVLQFPEAIRV